MLPDPEDWKTVSSGGSLRSSGTVNKETITNSKFFPPFMNNKGENNPTKDEVPEEESVPPEGGNNPPEEMNNAPEEGGSPEGGNDSPEGNVLAEESRAPEGGNNPPEGNQPEGKKTAIVEQSDENLPPDDKMAKQI